MPKWECNSCHAVYSDKHPDGRAYYHTCPPYIVEQEGVYDEQGHVITPEKRTARHDLRDENIKPGLFYLEGVLLRDVPDPETPGRMLHKPTTIEIISEGAGRTLVEA
jgi:hypothetical protein